MESWIIAIYLGFLQPITYGCFYYVLKSNPLYKVLPIVTMGISTGLLAAIILLKEDLLLLYIGGFIILLGVILIVLLKMKKRYLAKIS